MYTRCPKCNKEMDESLDICPNCKHDFTKQAIQGSGRRVGSLDANPASKAPKEPAKPAKKGEPDLPAHMLEDINSPPKQIEESVLPPHMLGDAAGTEADLIAEMNRPQPVVKKSGGSPI